jgi:murein DD-endopeptidase MepM/ murein hydrolase activator NlpD
MRLFAPAVSLAFLLQFSIIAQADQTSLELVLPTDNDALFSGNGPDFYQYIERDYQGVKSTPWEGGQYGFVRDPKETAAGIVYTRFHEGIDIKPVHRDATGEPLDEIHAIADGKVVHINLVPRHSNYGCYVVVEHRWAGSNYYSLYGHLSAIAVKPGQAVQKGQPIAVMGYTGKGINRERAHVHLELNLFRSHEFEAWHDTFFKNDPNHNGIYNGLNLVGLDIARLYLDLRKNPSLTIPQFLDSEEIFYKVVLPRSSHFELPKLYPWLVHGRASAKMSSWEVSFARSGLPLKIEPSEKQVNQPELTYVKGTSADAAYFTQDVITGRGANAQLSENGRQLMRLWIWPD